MLVSPKKSFSNEKTRSAAAEFGVKEKTICAAAAHVGNLLPLLAHQAKTDLLNTTDQLAMYNSDPFKNYILIIGCQRLTRICLRTI